MYIFFSVMLVLMVAYAQLREGLFTAATMFLNILIAGVLTFNFWEPLADEFDVLFADTFLTGFEDTIFLTLLFTIFLIVLRMLTNKLAPHTTAFPGYVQQAGGAVFGLLAGYLVAGFLTCVLQTLPWHENFMGYKPRTEGESGLRRVLPPDRVWLALMRYTGAHSLAWKYDNDSAESRYDRLLTFDGAGTFELRYLRYRRYNDKRDPLKYEGELERELGKEKPR